MDEYIDELLREERMSDIILPRIRVGITKLSTLSASDAILHIQWEGVGGHFV